MESVAAERLNKIGKNPSIVSNRDDFQDDIHTVNELIMQTTPICTSSSNSSSETSLNVDDIQELNQSKKEKKAKRDKKNKDKQKKTLSKLTLKKSKSDCYMYGKVDRRSPDRKSPPHDGEEEESLV